jgi:hypothetical protein
MDEITVKKEEKINITSRIFYESYFILAKIKETNKSKITFILFLKTNIYSVKRFI